MYNATIGIAFFLQTAQVLLCDVLRWVRLARRRHRQVVVARLLAPGALPELFIEGRQRDLVRYRHEQLPQVFALQNLWKRGVQIRAGRNAPIKREQPRANRERVNTLQHWLGGLHHDLAAGDNRTTPQGTTQLLTHQ